MGAYTAHCMAGAVDELTSGFNFDLVPPPDKACPYRPIQSLLPLVPVNRSDLLCLPHASGPSHAFSSRTALGSSG